MKRTYGVGGVVLLSLFSCALLHSLEISGSAETDKLLQSFPGYHLLKLQERDSETRTFVTRHYAKENPSVVHADFDGDGNADYALLLKNNKSERAKLAVLLYSGDGQYKKVYDLDITGYSDVAYLRPVKRGSRVSQTEGVETANHNPPTTASFSGIQITYFGKGKVVLYWDPKLKKIKEVQTGD